jgi:predicted component of type VI protein secretion system
MIIANELSPARIAEQVTNLRERLLELRRYL